MASARTRWSVTAAAAVVATGLLVLAWVLSSPARVAWLAEVGRGTLSEAERRALYDRMFADVGTLYDVAPDPEVARLGRRNHQSVLSQAEVRTNDAGFRDDDDWLPRDEGRFRVVCLGDSMVFGQGGPVEDRFCNQLEAWYAAHGVTVDGRPIETLAAGLPGWTLVQSTSWLDRRLTDVDPDLIVVLTMPNDITDVAGVTGVGTITRAFSPQTRKVGSGRFDNEAAAPFGSAQRSALSMDIGPQSRGRWTRAMRSLADLVEHQEARGGGTLLAVMAFDPLFDAIYTERLARAEIDAPLVFTNFFPSEGHRLPHDPHPDRAGHGILAHHLIGALDAAGLVPVPAPPELHPALDTKLEHPPDDEALATLRRTWIAQHVRQELSFEQLGRAAAASLLGGVWPAEDGGPPWASVRSGWLMLRPREATELRLVVELPDRLELLPQSLTLEVDGEPVGERTLEDGGRTTWVVALPETDRTKVVEVVLDARQHFSRLDDDRMHSVRLVEVAIH